MKMRINHLKTVSEQEDRLEKLNKRLDESNNLVAKLKEANFSMQHDLHEIEKKLSLLQKQRQNLMDIGEDGEKFLGPIDECEVKGLALLEAIDTNENEIRDQKQFSSGLTKTIAEIGTEVAEINSREQQEVRNLDLRLNLLLEELPENYRSLLSKVQSKNLAHGPFTRNENGNCFFCRYAISRIDQSEIDLQQALKQCPQCSRIFLPYGA